jgi:hypothetical protein
VGAVQRDDFGVRRFTRVTLAHVAVGAAMDAVTHTLAQYQVLFCAKLCARQAHVGSCFRSHS